MAPALPRPLACIRISPFQNGAEDAGRFLVEVGERRFVMNHPACQLVAALAESPGPAEVRQALRKNGGEDLSEDELRAAVGRLPPVLFEPEENTPGDGIFVLRFRLLREAWVQRAARILQHAFNPYVASLVLVGLVVALPWTELMRGAPPETMAGVEAGWLLLALAVSVLAHELGHASACQRFGVPPGTIGFGVYWVFPVLYADVTRAWKLAPRQRVVVDLGGIYFQAILLCAALPLWWWEPAASWVRLFTLYNLGVMIHNLNPLFKLDGYWVLSDFACVPNLHRRTLAFLMEWAGHPPASGLAIPRRMKGVLGGYAALIALYAGYLACGIPFWLENYFYPGISAGMSRWTLALDQFQNGAWTAAAKSSLLGSVSFVAVGLPLLLVPWALGKGWVVARAWWQTPPRGERVA